MKEWSIEPMAQDGIWAATVIQLSAPFRIQGSRIKSTWL